MGKQKFAPHCSRERKAGSFGDPAQRHVESPVSPFHRSCGTSAANFAA